MTLLEILQNYQVFSTTVVVILLVYGYHVFFVNAGPSEPLLIKGYLPFIGVALQAVSSPASFLTACRARYGDIFTLYVFGFRITVVVDPIEGIPAVFKKAKQLSFKAGLRTIYIKVLGFTPERADHEEMNKEHLQMFHTYLLSSSSVDQLTTRFLRYLLQDIRGQVAKDPTLKTGKVIDLFDWASARLFFSSAPALYGDGILEGDEQVLNDFRKFDLDFNKILMLPVWMTRDAVNARSRIQKAFSKKFAKGLSNPSDFILKRIEVQQKYGYSMETIGSDVLGLTFALMTNAMPMSFWYMTHIITSEKYHQPILERIHSYVLPNATLQSENLFNVSALLSDPLLIACFQEALRLQSQNSSVRIVQEDTALPVLGKEYYLRKGSLVFIPSQLIHMDPENYENVNDFEPERFLSTDIESALIITNEDTAFQGNKEAEKKPPPKFLKRGVPVKHYMIPFGGGDNLCTGRRFAQNEIIAMACTLLYLFEFENPNGGKVAGPAKPLGLRFGAAADGPGKPYMVKVKLRENVLKA